MTGTGSAKLPVLSNRKPPMGKAACKLRQWLLVQFISLLSSGLCLLTAKINKAKQPEHSAAYSSRAAEVVTFSAECRGPGSLSWLMIHREALWLNLCNYTLSLCVSPARPITLSQPFLSLSHILSVLALPSHFFAIPPSDPLPAFIPLFVFVPLFSTPSSLLFPHSLIPVSPAD